MNSIIFAAGLGTRLQPLTDHTPKALVQVQGKPLLWYAIQNVIKAGATRVVVNVHHFPQQVIDYVCSLSIDNVEFVISDERDCLLETGGGLLKAAPLFIPGHPILIHNADVLTRCDLSAMVTEHQKSGALATLMVAGRTTSRYFLFDTNKRLAGWQNVQTGQLKGVSQLEGLTPLAFNGVHIVDYSILGMLGETRKFSITDGYIALAPAHKIIGWDNWQAQWFDVGTLEKLEKANSEFVQPVS